MLIGIGLATIGGLKPGVAIGIGIGAGMGVFLLGALASFLARSNAEVTVAEWLEGWLLAGTRNLRRTFQVCPPPAMLAQLTEIVFHRLSAAAPGVASTSKYSARFQ